MISRRNFLQGTAGALATVCLPVPALAWDDVSKSGDEDPLEWVDLRIGTGGHGHCFPGAAVPFGAVQLSPDTFDDGWDWCSGYHISDTSLMGFSHTHLSGTGCGDLLDFLVMAGTGPAKIVPGTREDPDGGYRSRFSHDDEVMVPGYYSVLLRDYGVRAELTATATIDGQKEDVLLHVVSTHNGQLADGANIYGPMDGKPPSFFAHISYVTPND